jgi:hypothetical protein
MSEQHPSSEPLSDDAYLEQVMAEAEENWTNIPDAAARIIASQFHGGQASALYSLASSGAIDMQRLAWEFTVIYADSNTPEADKRKLDHLGMYLLDRGGWAVLWGGDE